MALMPRHMSESTREQARECLEAFWGKSNGGAAAYGACEIGLAKLKLESADYRKLARNLPTLDTGTTGQKLRSARALLEDLAEG